MPPTELEPLWPAAAAPLLRGLWGQTFSLQAMPDAAEGAQTGPAPVLQPDGERATLHLPPSAWPCWQAAVAHAAAHRRFGGPPQARKGLKPVQQALLGVLEDARVEWLACEELPGLRCWWRPFHTGVHAREGQGFEDLLARLSAVLLDPGLHDAHPWIAKVRQLFFERDGTTLALRTPQAVRVAASRLGNDIGQMRLPFNARTYRVHARYRDDNTHLWLPSEEDRAADTPLLDDHPPDEPPAHPPPPASAPWQLGEPVAEYPEWDHRIGRYRPGWTQVHEVAPQGASTGADTSDHLTRQLLRPCRRQKPAYGLGPRRHADGEALHAAALIDHAVALRLRQAPDPRVWRRPREPASAQAVLLLVDASVSTAATLAHWQSEIRQVAQALQTTGHRCAVWAFGSDGRHRVRIQRLKDWATRCEQVNWGALEAGGSTRMGAALRHAVQGCLQQRSSEATGSTVLLLTDGELHDVDVHDPAYLRADLGRAVREARSRGVRVQALLSAPSPALHQALGASACHRTGPRGWAEALSAALAGRD